MKKLMFTLAAASLAGLVQADWNRTAGGTYDYNDPANWSDGTPNGVFPSTLTLAGDQTIRFEDGTVLADGLNIACGGGKKMFFTSVSGQPCTVTLLGSFANSGTGNVEPYDTIGFDLGGATRTINCDKGAILIHGVISNGGILYTGAKDLRLYGANTFDGGFTQNSSGYIYLQNASCLGTGTVTFEGETSRIQAGSTVTLSQANPIVIKNKIYFSADKSVNLGNGPLTITKPVDIEVNKNTLTLDGQIAKDSPYGITAITKTGGGTLTTMADVNVPAGAEVSIAANAGTWTWQGVITGAGVVRKTGGALLHLSSANPAFTGRLVLTAGNTRFMMSVRFRQRAGCWS